MWLFGRKDPAPAAAPVDDAASHVSPGMRIAAAWSWRILLVAGAVALAMWLVAQLRLIVIPLMVAALLTALMVPLVDWLHRKKWPRGLAVAVGVVTLLVVVAGLLTLAITQIRLGWSDLRDRSVQFYENATQWLLDSPLHLTEDDINRYASGLFEAIQRDTQSIVSGALSVGTTLGSVLTGAILALFATIFLLLDGGRIWRWVLGIFPRASRRAVNGAGQTGWVTLGHFVRVQVLVAAIDAVGIGLGAWILGFFFPPGMPLVIPIAILVFLTSFIPFVGAIATGVLAVFVALVSMGPIPAIIMLGIVLLVQQIEGNLLQPLIMGNAVKVHPLAVVLAVTAGGIIAGIPGTLFAVPLVAFANSAVTHISSGAWRKDPQPIVGVADGAPPVATSPTAKDDNR